MLYARFHALVLTAFLMGTIAATAQPAPHHRYKLVVFGTLGGPQSFVDPASSNDIGGRARIINSQGTFAGFADTAIADPFPYLCFWEDCLVVHAFRSGRGGALQNLDALPGGGSSVPAWISDSGLIAGLSQTGETDPLYPGLPQPLPQLRAVLWENGTIRDLGVLPEGGYQSEANAVNSVGQVVGAALNTVADLTSMQTTTFASQPGTFWLAGSLNPPYQYQTRAFLWDRESGMQDLGTLPGGTDAQALLINEKGQVVGHSYTGSSVSTLACAYPLTTGSFLWEKEKGMVDLGSLGGTCTLATDLNNHGQVVGESNFMGDTTSAAFLWERGQIHKLGGSLGGSFTGAAAINEGGDTVGFAYLTEDKTFHASMWKYKRRLVDLGVLRGDQCSYATAINARGQIAGGSIANCTAQEPTFRAFLWERGTMYDLNTLIPANSPLYLQVVETINEQGEIAGTGVDASGNAHAYMVIPCDENHPGIEECDYSMVDASAAASVPQMGAGHRSPAGTIQRRRLMDPFLLQRRIGVSSPIAHDRGDEPPELIQSARSASTGSANVSLDDLKRTGEDNLRDPLTIHGSIPALTTQPSASTEEGKCPGGAISDERSADQPVDSAPLFSPGHCIEYRGKLTGRCAMSLLVAPGCAEMATPTCHQGAVAKRPGLWECCGRMFCVKIPVDLDSACPR